MESTTGTYHEGNVVPDAPVDWPEGTRVEIKPCERPPRKVGLDESEWRDDDEALADWSAWLRSLEPLEFTPEEEAAHARFTAQMRQFNIEAVRRQMQEDGG